MKNRFILPAIFLLSGLLAIGEDEQKATKSDPNIRPAGDVILEFERKIEIVELKRFREGFLELFPGDTVHLEFTEEGDNLVRPKVVVMVEHPKRTITFRMTQDKAVTMLYRESKIQKTVAMDCKHRGLGSEEFSNTNLYPTEKGLMAGDSWPNTVWILQLSNFEVTKESASDVYQRRVKQNQPQEEKKANKAEMATPRKPSD